jgi:hypothetical protein
MQAWRPQEKLVDSARAYFHREEYLTRLHRRMDYAERSYHRALKQLLQLQSGYPAPAQAKASTAELPPAAPVAAELEPSPNQLPSSGIGFVPSNADHRRGALGSESRKTASHSFERLGR